MVFLLALVSQMKNSFVFIFISLQVLNVDCLPNGFIYSFMTPIRVKIELLTMRHHDVYNVATNPVLKGSVVNLTP